MKRAQTSRHEKTIQIGVLNFKIQSTSDRKYDSLFEKLSAIRHVKVRGSEFGTIGYLRKHETDFLYGEIYLFLNIDPTSSWYDAEKREPVDSDAIGMETHIFDRLKPHLKQRIYLFDLRNHRLYYDVKGFHPKAAKRFFERLCEEADTVNNVGVVDIEIHSTQESIEEIFRIPSLTYLEVFISLPNPDDLTAAEDALFSELRRDGTLKYRETRRSTKEVGISPNERTKTKVGLSRTNGYTRAGGFEGNMPVKRFTQEHPEIIPEDYSTMTERPLDALLRAADTVYNRFVP